MVDSVRSGGSPAPVQSSDPPPTPAWFLELVGRAIDRTMPRKAAAAAMGIDQSQMTRELCGRGHLSALRLGALPPSFWAALTDEVRAHFGLSDRAETLRLAQEYDDLARRLRAKADALALGQKAAGF